MSRHRRDRGRTPAIDPGRSVAVALLPLRLFFGATFLYAGLDKLVDPRFFDPASPASIQAQLAAFARFSPIAPIVRLGEPLAVPIGLGIALLEIAVGLGALTGLAFRLAAAAGFALSVLFFLTASWATRPYYLGADLPYAAGWVSLAIAGHGGVLVPARLLAWAGGAGRASDGTGHRGGAPGRARPPATGERDAPGSGRGRRAVLQAAVLGALALATASLAVPFRRTGAGTTSGGAGSSSRPGAGDAVGPSSDAPASEAAGSATGPATAPSPVPSMAAVARVGDLAKTGARAFTVPFAAPAPFPAGDPAVIVRLADGSLVAFDAVCTHAGCTVAWDQAERLLFCPCHGATFDPADGAKVVGDGPTRQPLAGIPIVVDPASGAIFLRA